MLDSDTFLTRLYVTVDEFCKQAGVPPRALRGHRGPLPALAPSEVVTLAVYSQWGQFPSERAFYRHASHHLRRAFPGLPPRPGLNRLVRAHATLVTSFAHALATLLTAAVEPEVPYEVLDTTALVTRNRKRGRRARSWLAGQADIGYSSRLGWFEGLRLLVATSPRGVITGYALGRGSAKDQPLTTAFLAARSLPALRARAPEVGRTLARGARDGVSYYLGDSGFDGRSAHEAWWSLARASVVNPPGGNAHGTSAERWPAACRRWLKRARQVVESVFDRLLFTFRLHRERPHALEGVRARLAACVALHNFCLWTNHQLGRPLLAFADLVAW